MASANITYSVKKIENGYIVSYWFEGDTIERAFTNWKDTLKFLMDNPPKNLEIVETKEYMEIE